MTRPNDPSDDMARFPSPADAEGLLSGHLAADDLPEEGAPLARLLAALAPVAADDPFTERRVVSDITAGILRNPAPDEVPALLRTGGQRIPAKAGAALAFVAVLATGTAAAAANGSLPPSIQRAVSNALSHVSISVPHPSPHHPVESHGGGPGGRRHDGSSPGDATEPVTSRGAHGANVGDKSPRGVTNTTPGVTATDPGNNGLHNGADNGQHNGADNGKKTGQSTVTTTTVKTNPGKHNGADNGKKTGQSTVTTTTVKTNPGKHKGADNGNDKVAQNGNAGGNGNGTTNSHASHEVSGAGSTKGHTH